MSDFVYADMSYCSLCDRYFPGDEARAAHVQMSVNHPKCELCDRRFANRNSLRNHYVYSARHHYCAACDKEFDTAGGMRVHVELASVHRDDSDDEDDDEDEIEEVDGWEDALGNERYPEENQAADEAASDDESYTEEDEYWDEDDEEVFEEEEDSYDGFAPTHPAMTFGSGSESSLSSSASSISLPSSDSSSSDVGYHHDHEHSDVVPRQNPNGVVFTCALCLETPSESSATRCGHLFCTPCINTALDRKRLCPVCRSAAYPKQLRKLYLPSA